MSGSLTCTILFNSPKREMILAPFTLGDTEAWRSHSLLKDTQQNQTRGLVEVAAPCWPPPLLQDLCSLTEPHTQNSPGEVQHSSLAFLTFLFLSKGPTVFTGPCQLCSGSCSSRTLPGPQWEDWELLASPHPFLSAHPRPCLIHRMNYAHTSQTSPSTWATQGNSSTQVSGPGFAPTNDFQRPS